MTISADEIYLLNKMNATASKVQLGTLIQNAESVAAGEIALADGTILVGNSSGVGAARTMSGDVTISNTGVAAIGASKVLTAMILDANVTLAKLASGITPSHVVKFAGKFTTAGGDATESIPVVGAVAGDIAIVNVQTLGTGSRSIIAAIPTTDAITVTLSGDPTTDHILSYMVLRAAA